MKHNTDTITTHYDQLNTERAEAFTKRIPPLPEGFVTLDSLKANLDTGLIGDRLNSREYCFSYADLDALADANVDTNASELVSWLNNNLHTAFDYINQVVTKHDYNDNDPFLSILQLAQYDFYCDDLENHSDDVMSFYTLNQLIDAGIYAVHEDIHLFDLIEIDLGCDINDGVDSFYDKLRDLIESAFVEKENIDKNTAHNMAKKCIGSDFYIVNPYVLTVRTAQLINDKGYDKAFKEDWAYLLKD